MKPWHNAPKHACGGPIAPEDWASGVSSPSTRVGAMICTACYATWIETDPRVIAHAWWSQGAWDVQERIERGAA